MKLLENWAGVALGLVLLEVLLRGSLLEAAREPHRDSARRRTMGQDEAEQDGTTGSGVDVRMLVLVVLVLVTLGPRLVSLLV